MKHITLIIGLMVMGCGKTAEEKVVGEYERNADGNTYKKVFLDNGVHEWYINGEKRAESKWSISKEEIHVTNDSGFIKVYRFNKDKSIIIIAVIIDGNRTDLLNQATYKKIK